MLRFHSSLIEPGVEFSRTGLSDKAQNQHSCHQPPFGGLQEEDSPEALTIQPKTAFDSNERATFLLASPLDHLSGNRVVISSSKRP